MPLYEFECCWCNHITERLQPHEVTEVPCESCGEPAKKIMSSPNFRVTGFNASNGYNVPNFTDVIGPDGKEKKKWSRS